MKSCLGIFDSGLGGFSVLKRVVERHGDLPCVYLADTARMPFGSRSFCEIRLIATELISWLKEQNISAVLVACNTTNSLALDIVEEISDVKVFGLIQSAASMIHESRIGVLATPATAASKAYTYQIKLLNPNAFVLEQGCPAFVPLIEAGLLNSEEIEQASREYLRPLLDARVETIVLGCSHYPFLEQLLRQLLPTDVRLIDPAIGLAKDLDEILGPPDPSLNPPTTFANTRICVTSAPEEFAIRAQPFVSNSSEVELISLRREACFF